MTGTVEKVEIRSAGFPDYFVQFPHGDGAVWAQENELDLSEGEVEEAEK